MHLCFYYNHLAEQGWGRVAEESKEYETFTSERVSTGTNAAGIEKNEGDERTGEEDRSGARWSMGTV